MKAVLFDLDGTLLDRDTSLQAFIKAQYERFYDHLAHVPLDVWQKCFIELDANGYVWKDKVYAQVAEQFQVTTLDTKQLLDDYVTRFYEQCITFPYVEEMLFTLKKDGYKLGIITNGRIYFQRANLQALNIAHYFDVILVSEEEQISKPDAAIFRRVAEQLQVVPAQCVYIGDHPVNDIEGAQNVGMRAVLFANKNFKVVQADAIITSFDQLPIQLKIF